MNISLSLIRYDYFFRTYNVHAMSFTPEEIFEEVCWSWRRKQIVPFSLSVEQTVISSALEICFRCQRRCQTLRSNMKSTQGSKLLIPGPWLAHFFHYQTTKFWFSLISHFRVFDSNSLSNALARCSTTPWQERTGAGNIISDLNNLSTSWSLISGGLDRDNDPNWFWQLNFRRIYKKWGNGQYWYALVIIKCHCWIRYYWCTFISFLCDTILIQYI